jgi:nicotinate phosphoribosyltransferase
LLRRLRFVQNRKPQLATDYYQLSAGNVYKIAGLDNKTAVFDMFIRKNPYEGGYTVFAGLAQLIEYIEALSFSGEDIDMLRKNHPELAGDFLEYLRALKFEGEIYAPMEGTIVFPQETACKGKSAVDSGAVDRNVSFDDYQPSVADRHKGLKGPHVRSE